jgi:hypothetical protein
VWRRQGTATRNSDKELLKELGNKLTKKLGKELGADKEIGTSL